MNKADKVKQKLIKEVVIPSLIGVLIALLFLLAVVKPTGASEDSTRPMTGTVYFVSGRSVSIVSPDKRTWSYKLSEYSGKRLFWVTQYLKEPYLLEATDFSSYVLSVQRIHLIFR